MFRCSFWAFLTLLLLYKWNFLGCLSSALPINYFLTGSVGAKSLLSQKYILWQQRYATMLRGQNFWAQNIHDLHAWCKMLIEMAALHSLKKLFPFIGRYFFWLIHSTLCPGFHNCNLFKFWDRDLLVHTNCFWPFELGQIFLTMVTSEIL